MQSKMYQAGVTCTNCHNAHTGQVKAQDNSLCTQCHTVERYDTEKHHHHKKASDAALCVNCHMPATTYMEVDARRDHSFSIPVPQYSNGMKTPNACNSCHRAQSNQWSVDSIEKWVGKTTPDVFASINAKAQKSDVLALRDAVRYASDEQYPAIRRATLLSLTGNVPSRLTAETISQQLSSENPLIRRAAVEASGFNPNLAATKRLFFQKRNKLSVNPKLVHKKSTPVAIEYASIAETNLLPMPKLCSLGCTAIRTIRL